MGDLIFNSNTLSTKFVSLKGGIHPLYTARPLIVTSNIHILGRADKVIGRGDFAPKNEDITFHA